MKCAIITPVGPGHNHLYEDVCLPSIRSAIDYSLGPFKEVIPMRMDDLEGKYGRSARRNEAIKQAQQDGVDWIFFLDADDLMAPNAFEAFGDIIKEDPSLDGVWGLICEQDSTGEISLREGQPEVIESYIDLLGVMPYFSIQIGHFIRTECVAKIGFDEHMDTGEDFKLYYQLWKSFKCKKLPAIFFINKRGLHSVGPRGATGLDWSNSVAEQWRNLTKETPGRATVTLDEKTSYFSVSNPEDRITNSHTCGEFFEKDKLVALKELTPAERPNILEVGANVGNHVIYYAQHMNAGVIYPVEPNPEAIDLLNLNISLNGICHKIDRRGIGYGAGSAEGCFKPVLDQENNLGATRLVEDPEGTLKVTTLDALYSGVSLDIIKIDVEGMELDVLEGAKGVIADQRPIIWIEVLKKNEMPFMQKWCRANDYKVVRNFSYVNATDYFALPKEKNLES